MNILAVDASTKSSGYAIYKHNKLQEFDCITASSHDLFSRINVMVEQIKQVLIKNPDLDYVILEQVRQDGFVNVKTYKALMYLQGCICMMIHQQFKHLQIGFLYPSQWRKTCGIRQGRGVQRATQKQNDINWVKAKYDVDVNDDIADAIGLGYAFVTENG